MYNLQETIKFIANNHYGDFMRLPNVIGVGVGYKSINGYTTDSLSIHVLVKQKVPKNYIHPNSLIPSVYMGIATDVMDCGGEFVQKSLKGKIRPLQSGYGVGVSLYKAGTITCIVKRKGILSTDYYILSNNHVLADNNSFKKGTTIIQPAHEDGGRAETDTVAKLSEFVPLNFSSLVKTYDNYVDAAIAKLTSKSFRSNRIGLIGQKIKGLGTPTIGEEVRKIGRTTGLTTGKIVTLNATITFNIPNKGKLFFKDQILADIITDFGDSGSLLINKKDEAIGLFMGGPSKNKGLFNDFDDVLRFTKTELYT